MTAQPTQKVVQLIPFDGIGGVEVAARSLAGGGYAGFEFHKYFLAAKAGTQTSAFQHCGERGSVDDPRTYSRAIGWLLKFKPDVVIASLWRSCLVLALLKIVRPRTKTVVFLHFTKDVHFLDKVFTRLAMRIATEIWTDSEATRLGRIPKRLLHRSRVISFMVQPVLPRPISCVAPRFIFWGRLQAQKGLALALELFARIRLEFPDAKFAVVGPDGGQRNELLEQAGRLGLFGSVEFHGPMSRPQIVQLAAEHSFYLQTSIMEGMAMSVVEAMQLGLVPVVTPVGEIANYCTDSVSAVFVTDIQQTAHRLRELLENPEAFSRMASAAQTVWQGRRLYRDDVLAACGEILSL